jgi:phospho-N-acetylmuramoyl-pentapeptide-transferase
MGGIAIVIAVMCSMFADSGTRSAILSPPGLENADEKAVFLAFLLFGAIGLLDDLLIARRGKSLGLRAREKLLLQFIAAAISGWLILAYAVVPLAPGMSIRPEQNFGGMTAVLIPFTVLVVALANAANLSDGLDGLCAGVFALAAMQIFAVSLAVQGNSYDSSIPLGHSSALRCFAVSGALAGFLWHNAHPAKIFMGDTGSLALGAGAAMMSIMSLGIWWTLLIFLIPLLEMSSVVLQVASFKLTGRRIFRMAPLHHHLELCGWSETQVVTRFWIAQAVVGFVAMILAWGGRVWV